MPWLIGVLLTYGNDDALITIVLSLSIYVIPTAYGNLETSWGSTNDGQNLSSAWGRQLVY